MRASDPILATALLVGPVSAQEQPYAAFTGATLTAMPGGVVGRNSGLAEGDLDSNGREALSVGDWGTQARPRLTDKVGVAAAHRSKPKRGRPTR